MIIRIIDLVVIGVVIRQLFVLHGVMKSRRFLQGGNPSRKSGDHTSPVFYIVIPVLREASRLRQAVGHFESMVEGHLGKVVVVTTAREAAEAERYSDVHDTVSVAKELASHNRCVHLHYPDPRGLKADQLNFAADYIATSLPQDVPQDRVFLVFYDVDSRPPLDSLTHFEQALERYCAASVFHQSSRFELRGANADTGRHLVAALWRSVADSGALRANRFVMGYELPRLLNKLNLRGTWKHRLGSYVYAHVTGHGLCVRLVLLRELPFPVRTPLEDMHYSFLLDSRQLPMVPIMSLDSAEVPNSIAVQFQQLTRWFYGPSRFLQYLADPATISGLGSRLLAASAAAITIEWLLCAITLPLLVVFFSLGNGTTRLLIAAVLAIYVIQLAFVEHAMTTPGRHIGRAVRILCYPITFTMFGIAGLVGMIRMIQGYSGVGKTEYR